jgi:hypothetical protein
VLGSSLNFHQWHLEVDQILQARLVNTKFNALTFYYKFILIQMAILQDVLENYRNCLMSTLNVLHRCPALNGNKIKYHISEMKVDINLCTSSFTVITFLVFFFHLVTVISLAHAHSIRQLSSIPFGSS